jgi:hypothetical protein
MYTNLDPAIARRLDAIRRAALRAQLLAALRKVLA